MKRVVLVGHESDEQRAEPSQSPMRLIWRLGKTAESRGGMPGNHVVRMGHFSRVVAEQLGLPRQFTEDLFLGAPLHDIGYLGVPDVILMKRGELTPRESEIVRLHCQIGHRILSEECSPPVRRGNGNGESRAGGDMLGMAASIALSHHEKWDGKGYPRQLAGEQIPLEARIVAICDVFDSMTSSRPFREPYPEDASGKHFAPEVFQAFMAALPQIRAIKAQFPDRAEDQPELEQIWAASESWSSDEWETVGV
jgi:putative two-component system response regulator